MSSPFARLWIVTAPWAHPVWSRYAVSVVDLTTDTGEPPVKHREDVTHEVLVHALDPKHPTDAKDGEYTADDAPYVRRLEPANHGYQFAAPNDDAAAERIRKLVTAIRERRLSPDTDFRPLWHREFADGVSLVERRFR